MSETLGKIAFDAYRTARHGAAYDGSPIPIWEETAPEIRAAWEMAAQAVRRMMDSRAQGADDAIDWWRQQVQPVAETATIERLVLQPGDIVVVELAYNLSEVAREHIRSILKDCFTGHQVLILEGGAKISLIQPTNEDEHAGN